MIKFRQNPRVRAHGVRIETHRRGLQRLQMVDGSGGSTALEKETEKPILSIEKE
jgi:hypothetical protein